jgi:hypothetical protein
MPAEATVRPAGGDRAATIPAPSRDILAEILHDGAQRLLAQAIDAEVSEWIDRHADQLDDGGRRRVVRNGHHPTRTILTGVGPLEVNQPRVHDRRIAGVDEDGRAIDDNGHPVPRFRSSILPPYLRKTKAIEASGSRLGRLQSPGCTSKASARATLAKPCKRWSARRRRG